MNEDCLKLTSYFGERHRVGGAFVADALIEEYGRHEIAASILLRGAEGFGLKHHLRTDQSLTLSEDLPLVAVAVDSPLPHRGGARPDAGAQPAGAGHPGAGPAADRRDHRRSRCRRTCTRRPS